MVAWPSIRGPQRDGWRGSESDGVRRTNMDAGPAKVRPETTAAPAPEVFNFKWSDAHAATFRAFYAANKTALIDVTHWKWGVAVQVRFLGPPEWTEKSRWNWAVVRLEVFY
jgi:hypothetical protein